MQSQGTSVFISAVQGHRPYMEDRFLATTIRGTTATVYAVFDGHAGQQVAILLKRHLPLYLSRAFRKQQRGAMPGIKKAIQQTFVQLDKDLFHGNFCRKQPTSGSTAIVVIRLQQHLFVINTGDSRALVFNKNGTILIKTQDHKPGLARESRRIRAAGGTVKHFTNEPSRIDGNLAVSRAFGDFSYKIDSRNHYKESNAKVIVTPDIKHMLLNPNQDYTVVLASDGLWDVVRNPEVATMVRKAHRLNILQSVPKALTTLAIAKRRSGDNVTVMVVQFRARSNQKQRQQKQWTYKTLYTMAQKQNIRGRSTMRKAALAKALHIKI